MSTDLSLGARDAAPPVVAGADTATADPGHFPARPPISVPHRDLLVVERERLARQPGLGLAGIAIVLPLAVLLAFGLGSPEDSLLVLGPLTTFALPVIAMIAFWWEDWPGTMLRAPFVGVANTLLVIVAGIVATVVGQALVTPQVDLQGIFDPAASPAQSPTFPGTMALGISVFVAMLHLTLVLDGAPLRQLPRVAAGAAALAVSWAAGLALYGLAVSTGMFEDGVFGTILVCFSVVQLAVYVVLRGWPVGHIESRPLRFLVGTALVVGGGALAYGVLAAAGMDHHPIAAGASAVAAGCLIVGMLFERVLDRRLTPAWARVASLVAVAVLAVVLYAAMRAFAEASTWTRADPEQWIAYALNAVGIGIILHVAVSQRWPFAQAPANAGAAAGDTN